VSITAWIKPMKGRSKQSWRWQRAGGKVRPGIDSCWNTPRSSKPKTAAFQQLVSGLVS